MKARFRKLRALIIKAVVEEDCFALNKPGDRTLSILASTPGHQAFDFTRSGDKVTAFMEWLGRQEKEGILQVTTRHQIGMGVEEAWTNKYVTSAYQKGILRGRRELIGAGFDAPAIELQGGMNVAFNQPFHLDRVGLLYSRTFQELKGVTASMDSQISRVLSQGMADGKNPREIARLLTKTISGPVGNLGITDTLGRFIPAERRAQLLARTEIIRAHHVATIQEYRNWGLEGVTVQAEWADAGDGRVCEECAGLTGQVFTLDQIESMIPLHPLCRCIALPAEVKKAAVEEPAPALETPPGEVVDPIRQSLTNGTFDFDRLIDSSSAEHTWMKQQCESMLKELNIDVAEDGGRGFCDQAAVSLWDRLGQPKSLQPYSVMFVEEEHVLLYARKAGVLVDPTGMQFEQPFFAWKSGSPYKSFVKLTSQEIEDARKLFATRRSELAR
jgi:SPP1 gp7 family putative phage head morphogenesis protein